MTQLELLQKQLERAVARKAMDDADSVIRAEIEQREIEKIQTQITMLEAG